MPNFKSIRQEPSPEEDFTEDYIQNKRQTTKQNNNFFDDEEDDTEINMPVGRFGHNRPRSNASTLAGSSDNAIGRKIQQDFGVANMGGPLGGARSARTRSRLQNRQVSAQVLNMGSSNQISALNRRPGQNLSTTHEMNQKKLSNLSLNSRNSYESSEKDDNFLNPGRNRSHNRKSSGENFDALSEVSNNSGNNNQNKQPHNSGRQTVAGRSGLGNIGYLSKISALQTELDKKQKLIDNLTGTHGGHNSEPVQVMRTHKIDHDERVKNEIVDMLKAMIFGQRPDFYRFKALNDKVKLLQEAIAMGDGDIIVKVILFMKRTLNNEVFKRYLFREPVAVDHYCSYLRQMADLNEQNKLELYETLMNLNRDDEASYVQLQSDLAYLSNNKKLDAASRLRNLQTIYKDRFELCSSDMKHDAQIINQQVNLLELQIKIEKDDNKFKTTGSKKFADFEAPNMTELTINESIYYLALYHYLTQSAVNARNPVNFMKELNLNEKTPEFQFCLFHGMARRGCWDQINDELNKSVLDTFLTPVEEEAALKNARNQDPRDSLTKNQIKQLKNFMSSAKNKIKESKTKEPETTSSFLGNIKNKAVSVMKSSTNLLYKNSRPNLQISPMLACMLFRNNKSLREEFLKLIEDPSQRLVVAKMIGNRILEIDCYVELGNLNQIQKIQIEARDNGDVQVFDYSNKTIARLTQSQLR